MTLPAAPLISVVVVNYNCRKWLERFFNSLRRQTIFDRTEIIVVDNTSRDGSDEICKKQMAEWPNGTFLPTGGNYGFGGGGNRGAKTASGKYLLFLNPDVWLEDGCLEQLWTQAEANRAQTAFPLVLNYDSDEVQAVGAAGFDMFGSMVDALPGTTSPERFAVGTFFFVKRAFFETLGGFDDEYFLYCEELDLSWRAWIAGEPVVLIPTARLHHQAASTGDRVVENRTSEFRRFYANRSQLLTILKNAQGPLLALFLSQTALIAAESMVGMAATRRFSFVRWALLKPLADCWRLRHHLRRQRKHNRAIRQHGDFWMLRRFFRFGFGRWSDVKRLFHFGIKIDPARRDLPTK